MVDYVEDIVIDGTGEDGSMMGDGEKPPFALFSPNRQENVGGPYATREHADAALEAIRQGVMIPYTSGPCAWSLNGKPHPFQS